MSKIIEKTSDSRAHDAHEERVIARIQRNPEFAAEYLRVAIEEATDDIGKDVLLDVIRRIAAAYGIANVARAAGMKRESLSRALSAKGNPRFDTLQAITQAMGLQLTVQPLTPSV